MKRLVIVPLLFLIFTGCAAVLVGGAAGAGAIGFIKGELHEVAQAPLDRSFDATVRALDELRFQIISKNSDAVSGQVIARTAEDKRIEIKVVRQTDSVTDFYIRVNVFGDEKLSNLIYDKIRQSL